MTTEVWALVIAGLSFGVSLMSVFFNLRKDSKRLLVFIYRAEIHSQRSDGTLVKQRGGALQIELVNNGFRPLCVSHIGGDYEDPLINRIKRLLKIKCSEKLSFILNNESINTALLNYDNTYKIIDPSHKISITIHDEPFKVLPEEVENKVANVNKISCLYALDVDGTKYKISRSAAKKYKEDLIKLIKQNVIE